MVELADRTLALSSVLASFSVLPFAVLFGPDPVLFRRMFLEDQPKSDLEKRVYLVCVLMASGAWVGSLPMLLDWDRPWQQWPIPVYYGAIVGWVVGYVCFPLANQIWWTEKSND